MQSAIAWTMLHPRMTMEHLGFLPSFLSLDDPRSAIEQFAANYWPGWKTFEGFAVDPLTGNMTYPGDPAQKPLAMTEFRGDRIYFYDHSWVTVIQKDGRVETCRMD